MKAIEYKHHYPKYPFPRKMSPIVRQNIELNNQELESANMVLASKPIIAWVAPTGKCNLACSHCGRTHDMIGKGEHMDIFLLNKLFSQLFPYVERICFGGNNTGEPTLTKHWETITERLSKFSLIPDLLTNGTTLSRERIRQLVALHATIRISLEGIREATYFACREKHIDKLLDSIAMISQERDAQSDNKTRIHLALTIYYDNIRELPELIQKAKSLGVNRVEIHHLVPHKHQRYQSLVYHRSLANEIFDEAEELAGTLKIELHLPQRFNIPSMDNNDSAVSEESAKECPLPWIAMSIDESGIVTPCCASSMVMGNLMEQDLEEIWNGKVYQSLRRTVNSDNPPPDCSKCCAAWRGLNSNEENLLNHLKSQIIAEPIGEIPLYTLFKMRLKGLMEQNRIGRKRIGR